jgi:dihydrofolate reductase
MTKVFSAHATSVDGYITGPDPSPGRGLGLGGEQLFDWYTDGDTPVRGYPFRLSAPSASVFQALIDRVGAVIAGRKTYDDSDGFPSGSPHPSAPLFVLTHNAPSRPAGPQQRFVTTGIDDAIDQATAAASATGKDVALMGSGTVAAALGAGRLDEIVIHQVPVLLGGGTPLFQPLTAKVRLRQLATVEAPGVTHLTFSVVR